jgi:hypothetical protein
VAEGKIDRIPNLEGFQETVRKLSSAGSRPLDEEDHAIGELRCMGYLMWSLLNKERENDDQQASVSTAEKSQKKAAPIQSTFHRN